MFTVYEEKKFPKKSKPLPFEVRSKSGSLSPDPAGSPIHRPILESENPKARRDTTGFLGLSGTSSLLMGVLVGCAKKTKQNKTPKNS